MVVFYIMKQSSRDQYQLFITYSTFSLPKLVVMVRNNIASSRYSCSCLFNLCTHGSSSFYAGNIYHQIGIDPMLFFIMKTIPSIMNF